MPIFLHGLILSRSATSVPGSLSLGAGALRVLDCGALAALVSTVQARAGTPALDDVRAHDAALRAVVAAGATVAAVRYGQTFPSDADVRAHVSASGAASARLLEERDGCVEMRLLLPAVSGDLESQKTIVPPAAHGPGKAYLEKVRGRSGEPSAMSVSSALGGLVRAERAETRRIRGASAVVFSHLIARADEIAYRKAVTALPELAHARILGPLPLYSFAEDQ